MGDTIAMGFHSTVDYELEWDADVIRELALHYDIHRNELQKDVCICSERDLLILALAYIEEGIGGEFVPSTNDICVQFASHFQYRRTIGGTANRAAIAISKIGYESALSSCCNNRCIREMQPVKVHYFANTADNKTIYPHVILSYPAAAHIRINDIEIIAKRENRLMFSCDDDAKKMAVSAEFISQTADTKSFLLGCFSEVMDMDILRQRMNSTEILLKNLKRNSWKVMEDGCYIRKNFRFYVHKCLSPYLDILSMNEDELQDYFGIQIDFLNPYEVTIALQSIFEAVGTRFLVVHSAYWALAFGNNAKRIKPALDSGICLSATRFRCGDDFCRREYLETEKMGEREEGIMFCKRIREINGEKICCLPTKNLSSVTHPTVVGLGDFFAGGLVAKLSEIDKSIF